MSVTEGSKNWMTSERSSSLHHSSAADGHAVAHQASTGLSGASFGSFYAGDQSNQSFTPYRWTPCPEWEQTGRCKYNEMCYRRHGSEDSRLVPQGWEKKRSMRSSSQSSSQPPSQSGTSAVAGSYSNGAGHSQWSPRATAPRPAAPNPSKTSVSGPLSGSHAINTSYQAMSPSYQSYHGAPIGSPDSYDSDPTTSPTILSPSIMSPIVTSPSLSHRMSISSSPRDTYDHHQMQMIEKPWIWQPCRHWQDSGSCRYGDSCKYRHGPEDRRERPAPRPTSHATAHLMRSNSNSSMESMGAFSTTDSMITSRPNISLQPIGAQITSPNASMGTLPPFQPGGVSSLLGGGGASQGNVIWDLFAPPPVSSVGRMSPPLGENSTVIVQTFSDHLRNLSIHHPDSSDLQSELNSIHIQSMIAIQLQRENFLPITVQDPMRILLQSIAISSNPHEWQFALVRVLDFLNALLDHLFNKFVSVSISSPSSSFGQLPVDVPSKLSLIQPYIGGRLSGSINELYDLAQRASAGIFAPTQEEVITILEQLRRVAASTSKSTVS
jgi:hypothetical protein